MPTDLEPERPDAPEPPPRARRRRRRWRMALRIALGVIYVLAVMVILDLFGKLLNMP